MYFMMNDECHDETFIIEDPPPSGKLGRGPMREKKRSVRNYSEKESQNRTSCNVQQKGIGNFNLNQGCK